MNAYVGTIRATDRCPDACTGRAPCPTHQPVKGYRWAVNTPNGLQEGEAGNRDAAWTAARAAYNA